MRTGEDVQGRKVGGLRCREIKLNPSERAHAVPGHVRWITLGQFFFLPPPHPTMFREHKERLWSGDPKMCRCLSECVCVTIARLIVAV